MKVAYFDCFAGASGDMIAGALIDLGVSLELIENELSKLSIGDFELSAKRVTRQHIAATKFNVASDGQKVVRTWRSIRDLIEESDLSGNVKKHSLSIFGRIAEAEAKVHSKPVDQVHFHEVGAVDSIVDIVSSVVGIEHLGIQKVYSSPIATGTGMVKTEHGMLPVPAPATTELLVGIPIYSSGITFELTTPTGAAILTHYATFVEELPGLSLMATGYGAGERELEIPNVLRVMIGEEKGIEADTVVLLETNIDDISPEVLGYTVDRLLELGALDAWLTPIFMKKGRSASLLSVLTPVGTEDTMLDAIFIETSTLGVRASKQSRRVAQRETITVKTPLGNVRVKIGTYKGAIVSIAPEYEDCSRIAMAKGTPLKQVYETAKISAAAILQARKSSE